MPTIARDSYDQANNQLLIPAAVYLGKVYTNVIVTVANIVSVGGSGAGGGGLANYIVTTLAGSSAIGAADGTGPAASFWSPQGVTVDYHGNVYVADTNNSVIREISPAGESRRLPDRASVASRHCLHTATARVPMPLSTSRTALP